LALLARHPEPPPFWFGEETLGNLSVEKLYVYADPRKSVRVRIYELVYRDAPGGALHLSFERPDPNGTLTIQKNGQTQTYPADISEVRVAAPEGSKLERDEMGRLVLAWDFRGNRTRSHANEVWSLAKLRLHGFRFLREPASVGGHT